MRKSLTLKTFIVSLVSFLLIISLTIVTLISYFHFFYEKDKVQHIIDKINTFSNDYQDALWEDKELYEKVLYFNNQNNLDLWVYDYNENSIYSNVENKASSTDSYYYIKCITENVYYYFFLDGSEYMKLRSKGIIKSGQPLHAIGYMDDYHFIIVESIDGIDLSSSKLYMEVVDSDTLMPFDNALTIVSAQEIFNLDYSALANNLTENVNIRAELGGNTLNYESPSPINTPDTTSTLDEESNIIDGVKYTRQSVASTDYKLITFSKILFLQNGPKEIYISMSLQPVHEINHIMINYIPYFIGLALLLSLLIAFIYSKRITQPILAITDIAQRLSSQDFDVHLELNRTDEIGLLAASLNKMSINLNSTVDQLVEKNEKLVHDYAIKSRQEEARKAFIANASHELKTPIGVIRSYSEAILDGVKIEKQSYYLSVITDEAKHMERLISEMTMLSKFEGDINYYEESVDLDALMPTIVSGLNTKLNNRSISVDIKSDLGTVLGDRDKLCQVFQNLIDNAAKYSNENSTLQIESIHKEKDIQLFFHNECPHFDEDELKKVWDRFYKIDVSHNRSTEGSGLGLAIVKSILERHNSNYGVYNTRRGVCFYMSLKKV